MAQEGPNSPTLATDEGNWVNPTNVYSSDNNRAYQAEDDGHAQHILRAYTFGFSIPTGATIDGIYVEVEGYSGEGNPDRREIDVALSKGGYTPEGDWDLANILFFESGLEDYINMGGPTELWNGTWSDTDINSTDFGILIRDNDDLLGNLYIDHIRVTIYYTGGTDQGYHHIQFIW